MGHDIGLEVIYCPAKPPVATIVFVHGLFGNRRKTWTYAKGSPKGKRDDSAISGRPASTQLANPSAGPQDDSSSEVFWPSLLSQVLPDVQILTWGYDTDVDRFLGSASQNSIHQHATNLLADLTDLREEQESSPLIFVCHSLGGIVVKDAINQSRAVEGTRLKGIFPATHGIMFLGTPHRGSKSATMGKLAYNVTLAITKRPNLQLLRGLERNSEILDRISDGFLQTLTKRDIRLYSFREELETRKFLIFNTVVVDTFSSKIGHGREEVSSIPASHSGMTKFHGRGDIGFRRVSAQLKRWISELNPDTDRFSDCMKSLDDALARARYEDVSPSHAETFHWLFKDEVLFPEWTKQSCSKSIDHDVFWIQGKPGSGKSTLMKFATRNSAFTKLLSHDDRSWTIASFFFHDRGSARQKTLHALLQQLVFQIVDQNLELFPVIKPFYQRLSSQQNLSTPDWDIDSLKQCLLAIARQPAVSLHLCLFLDALDEHSGDNEELVRMIKSLVQESSPAVSIKICVASRPWPIFKTAFSGCLGLILQDHTCQDIFDYTHSRLADALTPEEQSQNEARLFKLTEKVAMKAQGVFIWVRLVVSEISQGLRDGTSFGELDTLISRMPEELKMLYARTIDRIDTEYRFEGDCIFKLVACSQAPLKAVQLFEMIKDYYGNDPAQDDQIGEWRDPHNPDEGIHTAADQQSLRRRLESRTGGLVEIAGSLSDVWSENTVQFIHQTVREFAASLPARGQRVVTGHEIILHQIIHNMKELLDPLRPDFLLYAKLFELEAQQPALPFLEAAPPHDVVAAIPQLRDRPANISSLEIDFLLGYVIIGAELTLSLQIQRSKIAIPPIQLALFTPVFFPQFSGSPVQRFRRILALKSSVSYVSSIGPRAVDVFGYRYVPSDSSTTTALEVLFAQPPQKPRARKEFEDVLKFAEILLQKGADWFGGFLFNYCLQREEPEVIDLFLRYGAKKFLFPLSDEVKLAFSNVKPGYDRSISELPLTGFSFARRPVKLRQDRHGILNLLRQHGVCIYRFVAECGNRPNGSDLNSYGEVEVDVALALGVLGTELAVL